MFAIGEPSVKAKRLMEVARECLLKGLKVVKPGNRLGDIGHAIQTYAEKIIIQWFESIVVMASVRPFMKSLKYSIMESQALALSFSKV